MPFLQEILVALILHLNACIEHMGSCSRSRLKRDLLCALFATTFAWTRCSCRSRLKRNLLIQAFQNLFVLFTFSSQ